MGTRLTAARIAALTAVTLAMTVGGLAAQADGARIDGVRFLGNRSFPEDSLSRAIATRDPECRSWVVRYTAMCALGFDWAHEHFELRERELPRDASRLEIWYQLRGFREVQVDHAYTLRENGEALVTFTIDEGTPVRASEIEFLGEERAEVPGLLEDLPIQAGDPLSTLRLDQTRDTLVRRLNNRGYAHAGVFRHFLIPSDDPYRARVTFEVEPGVRTRYGPITVTGNEELSESTIRRTIQFREGDLYSSRQILEARGRLFGLEIVRNATVVDTAASPGDTIIPVTVDITEGDAHRVRTGAGWSSAECMNVESTWTSRDFLGGGRRLQVRGRVSNILAPDFRELLCPQSAPGDFADLTWLAAADLNQPWIFSTRNSLSTSIFAERQSIPDIYIRTAYGAQVALTRRVGPQTPLTLSYRPELSRLDAAQFLFCTGFLVCTPEDIARLQGARWLSPVGLALTRNATDNLLNPRNGYRLSFDIEHAADWTGSEFRYDRILAEAAGYTHVIGPAVLAARVRGGWVGSGGLGELFSGGDPGDIVHPQRRFYAGGANSVRGFGQSQLGPRILAVPNVTRLLSGIPDGAGCLPSAVMDQTCNASGLSDEHFLEQPTGGTRVFEGNVELRVAIGSAFEIVGFQDFGDVWSAGEAASLGDMWWTPGAGVRLYTPIGPLRIDVAYKVRLAEELSVITSQIRPYDPMVDDLDDQLEVDGQDIPFVLTQDLAVLGPPVLFGVNDSRFQIHISIGQAF